MSLAYMICQAMCGNGVTTGMETISERTKLTRRVRQAGPTAFCAGAAGAAARGAAAFRIATTPRLTAGTATAACAWRLSHSYSLVSSFVLS